MGLFTATELEAKQVIKGSEEKGRAERIGKGLAMIPFHQSNLDSYWNKVYLGLG